MGWFLTKKKAAKKSRKLPKKGWDPARSYRLVQWIFTLLFLAGIAGGWAWGQMRLERLVSASARPAKIQVNFVDMPGWLPGSVAEELKAAASRSISPDPFDRESLRRAAELIAANAWVKQVRRVSRRPGGVVEVSAVYRQGSALVQTSANCQLIDREAVRLPFSYETEEAMRLGLPMIVGVRQAAPPTGKKWEGEDLAAGLRLAACVANQTWAGQIRAIDVSNHAGRMSDRKAHLKLLTTLDGDKDPFNNPGVEWGRAPGEERFYEPPTSWKLRRIAVEFSKNRRLDDRIVQVTTEPGLTRRVVEPETFVSATPRRIRGAN